MPATRFFTKESGKTTVSTALVKNSTHWNNKISTVNFSKVKNMVTVHLSGQTAARTKVIGAMV